MTYVLDVNVLIAGIMTNSGHFVKADAWLKGKQLVDCPFSRIGFFRIVTNSRIPGMGMSMPDAKRAYRLFVKDTGLGWIPDDLDSLPSENLRSADVMDYYLADLASKHGLKLATFDAGIKHPAVELIV